MGVVESRALPAPLVGLSVRPLRVEWVAILAVGALASAVRLFRIDHQSVWYDEAFSLTVAHLPLGEMNARILAESWDHPPLYYYLLHAWLSLLGFGVFQARLLSAVWGVLAVLSLYLLGRYLFGQRVGFIAATLLSVSQLTVMYSQEARSYTMTMFMVTTSVLLFIVALRERRTGYWWAFILTIIGLFYTNYFAMAVLVPLGLFLLIYQRRSRTPMAWLAGGALAGLVGFLPWMLSGAGHQILNNVPQVRGSQAPWFSTGLESISEALNVFNNAQVTGVFSAAPGTAVAAGLLLFTLPAALGCIALLTGATHDNQWRESYLLIALVAVIPAAVVISIGMLGFKYNVRYIAFCAPAYFLLVALGLERFRPRLLQTGVITAAVLLSLYSLRAVYSFPYKENYRDALAYLADDYRLVDCVAFLPFGDVPLEWAIYQSGTLAPRTIRLDDEATRREECARVWLVAYERVAWAAERSDAGRTVLQSERVALDEKHFFWVSVYLFGAADPVRAEETHS